MDGLTLLHEAQAAGLSVSADDGRLVIRGPTRCEAVAKRLLAHKADVLAALAQADAVLIFSPDMMTALRAADVRLVDDPWVDPWEAAIEPPDACPSCGSFDQWLSLAGDLSGVAPGRWRCVLCDPPVTARRLRGLAAKAVDVDSGKLNRPSSSTDRQDPSQAASCQLPPL